MLGASLVVVLSTTGLLALAVLAYIVAWWRGAFDAIHTHASLIFEPRDLRVERPWETEAQRSERRIHGEPVAHEPGEWGGWS